MPTIKPIFGIFDVDGVLVDSLRVYLGIFHKILRRYKLPAKVLDEFYKDTYGTPLKEQLEKLFGDMNIDVMPVQMDGLLAYFSRLALNSPAKLFPGTVETLEAVKRLGIKLCATSGSSTARLEKTFVNYGLPIEVFLGCDKIPKSNAHIFSFAKTFQVSLKEFCAGAFYVGDGETDMRIAAGNGIYAVGLTTTISAERLLEAGADVIIGSLPELLTLME